MRSSHWGALVALVGVLLAILGCGQADTTDTVTARAALEQASTLAATAPDMAARLAPSEDGFVLQGETAKSLAAKHVSDLHVNLPARADGEMTTSAGPWQLSWKLAEAKPASLEVDRGRALYRNAYRATDVVITAEPSRIETFFVLRDASAPSEFTWKVTVPSGLEAKGEGDGGIAFADATGSKRLRVGAAKAVDAKGVQRAAELSFGNGSLKLSLDTAGLTYPVLLDPPVETVVWEPRNWGYPNDRFGQALVYDSARNKVVLFGGMKNGDALNTYHFYNDTWEWDGEKWTDVTPAVSPPPRRSHALAYDKARGKVVLFGGYRAGSGNLNDTWEWDGTTWTERNPATSPSGRFEHALTYDEKRGKVVLFGGNGGNFLNDTWEWDGTNWTKREPASSPPSRASHALAYDSTRETVVLFGGATWGASLNDVWEWNGTTWTAWTNPTPAVAPSIRRYHAMAYDSARKTVVVFSGLGIGNEVWEWDGTKWTSLNPASSPSARAYHALAYDSTRGKAVLFGGLANDVPMADTWEWDGATWNNVTPTSPHPREGAAIAYDDARKNVVLVGGHVAGRIGIGHLNDTWTWDGTEWTHATTGPRCRDHALAYDSTRERVVLFGGYGISGLSDSTYEWDGTTWAYKGSGPTARHLHALAYDAKRQNVVLFGGEGAGGSILSDTWVWNGSNWANASPAQSPLARNRHALAYDSVRERVVLFGGLNGSARDDTWEWNGSTWTQVNLSGTRPPARYNHSLVYDSARKKVVLFGGRSNDTTFLSDTWEWDGSTWTQVTTASRPRSRYRHSATYDSARGRVVLYAGVAADYVLSDVWEYHTFGGACSSDDQCNSGYCVDGVCCESACGGKDPNDCLACSVAAGAAKDGICGPIANGTTCDDGNACTGNGTCQAGTCVGASPITCRQPGECEFALGCDTTAGCVFQLKPAGTTCRAGVCDGGMAVSEAKCDGVSNQCPVSTVNQCGLFACEAGSCRAPCATAADCVSTAYCDAGTCQAKKSKGDACGNDQQCATGHCVDGVCCDTSCDGQCQACDIAGSVGTCSLVTSGQPHGTRDACAGSGTCQGTCDGSSATACAYPGNDVSCGEDTCEGGKAIHGPACDGSGACVASSEVDCGLYACGATKCLTTCTSDDDCVGGASCVGGSCVIAESDAGTDGGDDVDGGNELDGGNETDGGDATDGGDDVDAGDDAGANPSPADGGDTDGGSQSDPGAEAPAEAAEEGCSCRTVGGKSQSGHGPWLGVGLAIAVLWRRRHAVSVVTNDARG